MTFKLFNYINDGGENEFKTWTAGLEKIQRAKLNEKIDKLHLHGDALHPHMLSDTEVPGIQKLRVQGGVKLRPLLCKGPVLIKSEYTFLKGAKEIGSKWSPKNAPRTADSHKIEVANNPVHRRKDHENIN